MDAPLPKMMVSRRKILSRSRDELHSSNVFSRANGGKNAQMMEEDDCWHTKEKLFQVSTPIIYRPCNSS